MPHSQELTFVMANLSPHFVEMLRALPHYKEIQLPRAQARLFPSPTLLDEETLQEDWKTYVHPDLKKHFQSARQVVEEDLKKMEMLETGAKLCIPSSHLDAWMNLLNQTRLAMVEVHRFSEEDLDSRLIDDDPTSPMFRLHFYGYLQQSLVEAWHSQE